MSGRKGRFHKTPDPRFDQQLLEVRREIRTVANDRWRAFERRAFAAGVNESGCKLINPIEVDQQEIEFCLAEFDESIMAVGCSGHGPIQLAQGFRYFARDV